MDYNAEGLLLFTDSPEMRDAIAANQQKFDYHYLIKVHGKFDDKKLISIRKGATIKGKKMGPFFVRLLVRGQAIPASKYGHFDEKLVGQHAGYQNDFAKK